MEPELPLSHKLSPRGQWHELIRNEKSHNGSKRGKEEEKMVAQGRERGNGSGIGEFGLGRGIGRKGHRCIRGWT